MYEWHERAFIRIFMPHIFRSPKTPKHLCLICWLELTTISSAYRCQVSKVRWLYALVDTWVQQTHTYKIINEKSVNSRRKQPSWLLYDNRRYLPSVPLSLIHYITQSEEKRPYASLVPLQVDPGISKRTSINTADLYYVSAADLLHHGCPYSEHKSSAFKGMRLNRYWYYMSS